MSDLLDALMQLKGTPCAYLLPLRTSSRLPEDHIPNTFTVCRTKAITQIVSSGQLPVADD